MYSFSSAKRGLALTQLLHRLHVLAGRGGFEMDQDSASKLMASSHEMHLKRMKNLLHYLPSPKRRQQQMRPRRRRRRRQRAAASSNSPR
jgi:hypothetical protein